MQDFEFLSEDVDETEAFLSHAYSRIKLGQAPERAGARMARRSMPGVTLDELAFDFDMDYEADPLGLICLCSVRDGVVTERHVDRRVENYGPGEIVSLAPPEHPPSGVARKATYGVTLLDPALLVDLDGRRVDLTSDRPASAAAAERLKGTVAWLGDSVLDASREAPSELVRAAAARSLAAAVLDAFPHTGTADDGRADPGAPATATVRRALSFIDSEADAPIGVLEIASAAGVTPRALQYAFQRHLDTTPLARLRRVRLDRIRRELADPDENTSVTAAATRWGFAHLGRFSGAYREEFGEAPATTLARGRRERPEGVAAAG